MLSVVSNGDCPLGLDARMLSFILEEFQQLLIRCCCGAHLAGPDVGR